MHILDRWQKDIPNDKDEKIVFAVLNELIQRVGFDDWWEDVDESTQLEILESLLDDVKKVEE